jgi:hypothetical protein
VDEAPHAYDRSRRPHLQEEFDELQWPVVGFTTAEHNTLVALRTASIAETNGRASAYLATLSAALVAVGLVGGDEFDDSFFAFGLVALLAPALVGLLTFARCLQSSVEDLRLARRVERLRATYLELVPGLAERFQAPAPDAVEGVRRASGTGGRGHWQLALTLAGLIALVNSLVLGVCVGFGAWLLSAWTGLAVGSAALVAVLSAVGHTAVQARTFRQLEQSQF